MSGRTPTRFEAIVVVGVVPDDLVESEATAIAALTPSVVIRMIGAGDDLPRTFDDLWAQGIGRSSIVVVDAGADRAWLTDVLRAQLRCRAEGALPTVEVTPGWALELGHERSPASARADAATLTLSNGTVGIRGDLEDEPGDAMRMVLVSGAFGLAADGLVRPLPAPVFTHLHDETAERSSRVLDLRTGMLGRYSAPGGLSSVRFAPLTRGGAAAIRAEDARPAEGWTSPLAVPGPAPLAAANEYASGEDAAAGTVWAETVSDRATVTAAASQTVVVTGTGSRLERLVAFDAGGHGRRAEVSVALRTLRDVGFDGLLREHRHAWAERWSSADIEIHGDAGSQVAVRYALFHLLSCAPTEGEGTVGARGLTGLAYAGHVFWDTDVFVLPALAATLPSAARAILQYRIARLPAARRRAIERGMPGVRFPWESADTGDETTPESVRDFEGRVVPVETRERAEHINADIAWAALHYADWTSDVAFVEGPGRPLVSDTARYWEGRARVDESGRAHLDDVVGPDEYHERVDDNAYTNGMARWHLQRAADLAATAGDQVEAGRLRALPAALVTGYDAASGRHEQFAGFAALDPVLMTDIADPPIAADLVLGRERVRRSQISKQADVLMLHHLLPDEQPRGSLEADLDFYLPRTAHGSSLSPAIGASLLARAGRPDDAMALFDIAARLDLDDLTGTTAGGLHLATMGGLWQAVVFGFAGIRPTVAGLQVAPRLPRRWQSLDVRLRFRGVRVRIALDHREIHVDAERPVPVVIDGAVVTAPLRHPIRTGERSSR